ncbi:MAG: BREX-1 system adenine-specific DNA-methyltransferase PglX [Clostridia bacterium]|nr:BREX-1 system adenine-specific DNA-methyltransferase PglX [Clostridia bacterium]
MNKNAIQKYAVWARNELIDQVKQRAYQYGISDKGYGDENASVIAGRVLSADEKRQRCEFVTLIKENGYQQAVEEVAYTWFNRFVALRFMEVNDYLPSHVRVFSDANGEFNPEILKEVLHLDLPELDKTKVSELLNANQTEELYRYLLLIQCNALNAALPEMFGKLGSYTEMLLPNNILKQDSVLARLVKDIPEEDWRDAVQIIGWLYQYYNTEPKQAVFDGLKKNIKITKDKIPAATQLFTPDWIVRYMVENSLGRLWVERCQVESGLDSTYMNGSYFGWKYYIEEAKQTPEVAERLRFLRSQSPVKSPEDIRLIDPCMGSGHILVYAFDVLMQIYEIEGYNPRDAAKLILEKNLYGLDIDRRAYQLAYFSLMMKARQYNRRIFTEDVKPQVYRPTGFLDGEEYGSLVKVESIPPRPVEKPGQLSLEDTAYALQLNAWNFKRLLAQKYDVVVTNPPYMGGRGMGAKLSKFVKKNYPDSKSDLFAVFVEKCGELLNATGYQAMITQHTWMFLSSYEKLRGKLIHRDIVNMTHLGARAFEEIGGEVVQTTAFVLSKRNIADFEASYVRLVDYNSQQAKEKAFLSGTNRYTAIKENFEKIPGCPVAYWVGDNIISAFTFGSNFGDAVKFCVGISTADNNRFLRYWHEIRNSDFAMPVETTDEVKRDKKWFPFNNGGETKRWYGNNFLVINWENDGREIKATGRASIRNKDYYFQAGFTWSDVSTGRIGLRQFSFGHIFSTAGLCVFGHENLNFVVAFLNSVVSKALLEILCPSIHFNIGDLAKIPILEYSLYRLRIDSLVGKSVTVSRADWDAFETSWDFKAHPLVAFRLAGASAWGDNEPVRRISSAYKAWEMLADGRFQTLKANEEELNRIFIDIYGLQDELTPEVEDKDVTVRRADLGREVRSLISYAVGCMFGRYSLDVEGLAYAGGDWDAGKYRSFIPDKDNILPICDDEYFDDDIVARFTEFVRVVYGAETLEENLEFIADALGGKGTPREVIRNYFLNDFYKDHGKTYQKRPIYWLFDSGKKNGFKALTYLHRYSRDLLAKLRTDYVHEQQERYRTQLTHIAAALNTATGPERARLLKQQDKLTEQSREIGVYEEKVHHLADMNIAMDLDDGVKKNYGIFADVLAKI